MINNVKEALVELCVEKDKYPEIDRIKSILFEYYYFYTYHVSLRCRRKLAEDLQTR